MTSGAQLNLPLLVVYSLRFVPEDRVVSNIAMRFWFIVSPRHGAAKLSAAPRGDGEVDC